MSKRRPGSDASGSIFEGGGDRLTPARRMQMLAEVGRREHWLLDMGHISIAPSRVIGKGGSSTVVEGACNGLAVAVKMARPRPDDVAEEADDAERELATVTAELRILRHLRHPHIAAFYGVVVDPCLCEVALVLEHVQGASLDALIGQPGALGEADKFRILFGVGHALQYLHGLPVPVVHGDVKPANVLVESVGRHPKLVDFGASKRLTAGRRRRCGSPRWLAPEVFAGAHAHKEADTFGFGRLTFFLLAGGGLRPFGEKTSNEVHNEAAPFDTDYQDLTAEASTLIETMWGIALECSEKEPVMRPEMMNVMLHMSELATSVGFGQGGLLLLQPASASELQPWVRGAIVVRNESPILQRGRGRRAVRHRGSRRRARSSSSSGSPASSREPSLGRVDEDSETAFDADATVPIQPAAVASETLTL